jgi:catechol 2,3-dioxygenase-like lactoylglutathione lyase family enzyme
VHVSAFDHVALWVDERAALAALLCDVCGMHEIEHTDVFTLVGGDARQGKLTLFEADGPRRRGVLERIVLRVPDLEACLQRAWAAGVPASAGNGVVLDAPAGVPLGLVQRDGAEIVDLDHVVLRVGDPATSEEALAALGFERRGGGRLAVGDREVRLEQCDPEAAGRPLLNHLALLVGSLDETMREVERNAVAVDRLVDAPNTVAAFVTGPDAVAIEYVEHKPGFALV